MILVTGTAGFIGNAVAKQLLERGDDVIGVDKLNDYYDVSLKKARLDRILSHENYIHCGHDLSVASQVADLFDSYDIDRVIHLAAQPGVRYSLENPVAYIRSNIDGFLNILEACRHHQVEHLVYASTSSVYGANEMMPYSPKDNTNHPVSLYAATKKANEVMAHSYSQLFGLPTTGLRFFTVYGPWSRPDMALLKFAHAIMKGEKIDVYGYGKHKRDFTYIDDIVEGVIRSIDITATPNPLWSGKDPDPSSSTAPYRIYNIGSNNPIVLNDYIKILENELGVTADINYMPQQPGDVAHTFADVTSLMADIGYQPQTSIEDGVAEFVKWFREFYNY